MLLCDSVFYMTDFVNKPPHYTREIEVYDFISCYELGYELGNVVKYVARHKDKGRPLEDLKKSRWYLDKYIEKLEKENA